MDPFVALLGSGNGGVYIGYEWDAENRLIAVTPQSPQAGDQKVEFAYDHMGRRIGKVVSEWTAGAWAVQSERKFVWSGWLLLMELDGNNDVVRKYTWGLDLAGQGGSVNSLEDAGGIGGLLALEAPQTVGDPLKYVYTYDANGNVSELLDLSAATAAAAIVAHYEYDPFGNVVNDTSGYAYADENPFRFSTKYWDDETGLGYWGYRYYSPRLGRWVSRDPSEETGGVNLQMALLNDPVNSIDDLGMQSVRPATDEIEAEPYGTCDGPTNDCRTTCLSAPPDKQGYQSCNGDTPCWCVCANNIRQPTLERKHEGLRVANQLIQQCTEVDEKSHASRAVCGQRKDPSDPSDECKADTATIECAIAGLSACLAVADAEQARRCVTRVRYWNGIYNKCHAYRSSHPARGRMPRNAGSASEIRGGSEKGGKGDQEAQGPEQEGTRQRRKRTAWWWLSLLCVVCAILTATAWAIGFFALVHNCFGRALLIEFYEDYTILYVNGHGLARCEFLPVTGRHYIFDEPTFGFGHWSCMQLGTYQYSLDFPLWPFVILCGVGAVLAAYQHRRRRRGNPRACPNCRYDLTGNVSGRCPECGRAIDHDTHVARPRET